MMAAAILRRLWAVAALLACIAAIAFPAGAVPVNGMLLDPPAASEGWTEKDMPGGIVLLKKFPPPRAGEAGSGAFIDVLKPGPAQGDLAAGFTTLIGGLPELARQSPLRQLQGVTLNGDRILVKDWCCGRRQNLKIAATVVGIEGRGRQAFALLTELNLDGDHERQVETSFQSLIRSWRLDPADQAFGLAPPKDGGGLNGVYTYFESGLMPNAFGGMSMYANNRVTIFDPAGRFTRAIPSPGQDIADYCLQKPLDCGVYRLLGGGLISKPDRIEMLELSNLYGMFHRLEEPFAHDGDDLKIGGVSYRFLPPLPKGATLSGTWHYSYAAAGSTMTSSGGVAIERGLTLGSDGRFTRTGWGGASVSNESGGVRTGVTSSHARPAQAGRYEIDGYHLVLSGDDGAPEVLSLFEPQRGSDAILTINGANYLKNK